MQLAPLADAAVALGADGDFRAQIQTYSLPAQGGGTRLKLLVQIPASELSWAESGDSLQARVRLLWSCFALGEEVLRVDEVERLARPAGRDVYGQSFLYIRERVLPPGEYRLELSCQDEGRKIGGIAGFMGRHPEARLSTRIEVRPLGEDGAHLADPQLYAYAGEGQPAQPRPGAVFAAQDAVLELRSAFVPPAGVGADSLGHFGLELSIADESGTIHFERRGGWRYADSVLPLDFRLPIDGLTAGNYRLELSLTGETLAPESFSLPLQILGKAPHGPGEAERRAIEAQLLLSGDEYRIWEQYSDLDRIGMMRRFWKSKDPNPDSEENEVYEEFVRRFDLAQERYTVFKPGALSDRGRVLIRFGEPQEIKFEVMPMNRRALVNAVRDLHGRDSLEPGSSMVRPDVAEGDESMDPDLVEDLSRIGTGNSISFGNESEPFEVWIYELDGKPLLPEQRLRLHGVGLKLIFADKGGYGDYELVYRSEDFDF